jgi:hypothetical protein
MMKLSRLIRLFKSSPASRQSQYNALRGTLPIGQRTHAAVAQELGLTRSQAALCQNRWQNAGRPRAQRKRQEPRRPIAEPKPASQLLPTAATPEIAPDPLEAIFRAHNIAGIPGLKIDLDRLAANLKAVQDVDCFPSITDYGTLNHFRPTLFRDLRDWHIKTYGPGGNHLADKNSDLAKRARLNKVFDSLDTSPAKRQEITTLLTFMTSWDDLRVLLTDPPQMGASPNASDVALHRAIIHAFPHDVLPLFSLPTLSRTELIIQTEAHRVKRESSAIWRDLQDEESTDHYGQGAGLELRKRAIAFAEKNPDEPGSKAILKRALAGTTLARTRSEIEADKQDYQRRVQAFETFKAQLEQPTQHHPERLGANGTNHLVRVSRSARELQAAKAAEAAKVAEAKKAQDERNARDMEYVMDQIRMQDARERQLADEVYVAEQIQLAKETNNAVA